MAERLTSSALTRRDVLRAGVAGGAALALGQLDPAGIVERARAAAPAGCGRLQDIEHVVIFVQENRSFDSYFGSYRGVRGFADPRGHFAQPGYDAPGYGGRLYPFHLDTRANGECTNDITHDWDPQHASWNGGAMDGFVREHLKAEGSAQGPVTMGYFQRPDLPFYYALADAFTICDAYHCSVLGPTDPNQLYLASAWLGQDGQKGGPVVETFGADRQQRFGSLSWTTMPEQLEARGISWKVYSGDNFSNEEDPPFALFSQYYANPALNSKGLVPTYPADFMADAGAGALPQVSWVYTTIVQSEHPPAPVTYGEQVAAQVVSALTSNEDLWKKTALLITWDENGGFFDHVPPPTAPPGTAGEYLTAAQLPGAAMGMRGPIGLGFRVPMLVVSPFARGGFVCSERFDHTSILRLLEARFGAEVPNLAHWRRDAVGDLTAAFNFARPDDSVPAFPQPSAADPRVTSSNCTTEPATLIPSAGAQLPGYPVPPNSMPTQEPGKARRPSGSCGVGKLRVTIHGLPRQHCAPHGLRVTIDVHHSARLRSVTVKLNGRTVRHTTHGRIVLRIPAAHLREGRNRIQVIAIDAAGRVTTHRAGFTRCRV
ncbi:MAG: phospholipase [Thermoleophilaceae bacterium]|nr:phospholipase [Thermoleophilaceae bacterium]